MPTYFLREIFYNEFFNKINTVFSQISRKINKKNLSKGLIQEKALNVTK